MEKATEIYQCCKLINDRFETWAKDPHDIPLPPDYYAAIERLIDLSELGRDITTSLSKAFLPVRLQAGVQKLQGYLEDYVRQKNSRPNSNPSADFFSQINHVVEQVLAWPTLHMKRVTVDTVENLHRAGIYPSQIALMYGMIHEKSGEGRGDLIEQELANPGSVITKDFVHPQETLRQEQRKEIEDWVEHMASGVSAVANPEPAAFVLEDVKTLAQAKAAGLSVKSAATHLGLPEVQVQSFYDNEDNLDDSCGNQEDDSEDPDWAKGVSFTNLCLKARDLGIVTRKSMKRSTVVSKIEEAMANAAN